MTDSTVGDEPGVGRTLPPWWVVVLVGLAIAAVAFAIGRFSTFGIAGSTPGEGSADAGFARDMQMHHAQAVDMAMTIYAETEDDELRALAYDIATGQSSQRGEMLDWLVRWGLPQYDDQPMAWMAASDSAGHAHGGSDGEPLSDEEVREQMGMASDAELTALKTATGQEADCSFLTLMIRHHRGAIPMAEAAVDLASDERVRTVAETMIKGQTFEIQAMTSMQERLGCGG
ncbi:DUF305 domain-containing protein [Microbacterium oleivorans]|uniref:DUF305 domain-containing protein n=1 Tax=Microbacterium oleivorans TaxID=273677 RepID=UPI00203D344B|nr:DUF305 domain-containing protein [Microbacterium oleivorans]MCM3695714.1 DUF305 domain-containing protein [Microbacterium oleivorans]